MKYIIVIYLFLFQVSCTSESKSSLNKFDSFSFFVDTLHIAGGITIPYKDSIKVRFDKENNIKIRSIQVSNILLIGARINEFTNTIADTIPPVTYTRKYTHPLLLKKNKHIPKHITKLNSYFYYNNILYTLNSRLPKKDSTTFYYFCKSFNSIISSKSPQKAYNKMILLGREYNSFLQMQMVQLALHKEGYYNGKYCRSFGDTLSETDKKMFNNAIKKYRKDQNLDTTKLIDTLLLKSMQIPLDPIEESLRKYKADQQTNN